MQHAHSRVRVDRGWARKRDLVKGPSGRNLCRQCSAEVPRGRRTFCGQACVDAWRIQTDPGFVRDQVEKRDRGVCRACGLDTAALMRELGQIRDAIRRGPASAWRENVAARDRLLDQHKLSPHAVYPGDFWQADHVVPVAEGGGCCGLDNLQTLCTRCHKEKTAAQAARAAEARKAKRDAANLDGPGALPPGPGDDRPDPAGPVA